MAFLLGERMNYIIINKDNIDTEHICCAMSNKKSLQKKEWLKKRFDEGLVFYRSEENASLNIFQINMPGYLLILMVICILIVCGYLVL